VIDTIVDPQRITTVSFPWT